MITEQEIRRALIRRALKRNREVLLFYKALRFENVSKIVESIITTQERMLKGENEE